MASTGGVAGGMDVDAIASGRELRQSVTTGVNGTALRFYNHSASALSHTQSPPGSDSVLLLCRVALGHYRFLEVRAVF